MLKKYQNFVKLSKNKQCNLYEANIRSDMNKALLKRLKFTWSWNQMLKNHALKIQSAQDFTPKILEIFKHNTSYFVVYERPIGPSLRCFDSSIKLQHDDFYNIFNQLMDYVAKLKQSFVGLYIYPQWIFLHRNRIKICHFQPYFQQRKDKHQQNHVFIYDMLNGNISSKKLRETEQNKAKRTKNLNFNLGYIAYHLLTGKTTQWKQNQQNYESVINQIKLNVQQNILKQINDKILASFILRLFNCTDDQITFEETTLHEDLFSEFKSYLKRKQTQCRNCKLKKQNFKIVEFSLEKIKLQKKIPKTKTDQKKKSFRPCCCTKIFQNKINPQLQDNTSHIYQVVNITQKNQTVSLKRPLKLNTQKSASTSENKLEKRTFSNLKTVHRQKINASSILPSLGTERRNSTMSSKTKNFNSRETMFKKSLNAAQIARSYLKTQY